MNSEENIVAGENGKPRLTEEEIEQVRYLLKQQANWRWLRKGTKEIAAWLAVVVGGYFALKTAILQYLGMGGTP